MILSQFLIAAALPIKFSGNHTIDDRELYEVIGLKKPYFFEFWKSAPKLEPKKVNPLLTLIENYYKSHGFYHAKAKSSIRKNRIVIEVEENEPIRVENVSTISPLPIDTLIPFEKGDRFDPEKFIESKKRIQKFYANHQYCNVKLNTKAFVDIEKNRAYIVYDVTPNDPCVFGKISIHAPESVEPKIIASLLHFREGDPYSAEVIRRSYREIYANEGIERVVIDDGKHDGNKVPVNITVSVYPKPVHITTGAGFSSDEGINLQAGIKHRNFFGNLKTLGLEARYSQVKAFVRASADTPLPNHNRASADIGAKREIYDGYHERSLLARINLKQSRYPHFFQESLIYDDTTTSDSNDPENFPNGKLRILSPLGSWEIDKRDSVLEPTKGYKLQAEGMGSYKSEFSDATYYKVLLTGAYHRPFPWGVSSVRLKYGAIKVLQGKVPPSYRFYAGGMNSNRAYSYRQLGPKNGYGDPIGAYSITEGTVELRIPMGSSFKTVVFSDITYLGQTTLPDYGKPYIAVGPGIRYKTPIGPIALDAGFDIDDLSRFAIHFHIGELF
ncbi:hypothetical protein HCR_00980 [Hydrogenimonas cancrithermarum]|uniref:Uncharacterized protein n=1 Tax=Hydrogenimonas cancrithermarum TaxID=2993563 RepID=A0ABM8FKE0_9BACT|nr:hypothetical protein HCR_00980 [Hydrogenimonas cancrithermarum]